MSLINKIAQECEEQGLEFLYDSGQGIEQLIADADFTYDKTVVYAFLLSTTNFVDGKESANFGIFFAKPTDLDFEAIENEAIQETCKQVAFDFIRRIERGNRLTIGDVTLTRFYDEFQQNVTGVAINATFAETVGLEDCFDDYRKRFDPYCGG